MPKRNVCSGCGNVGDCTVWIIMSSYTVRRYCSNCAETAQYYGMRPYGLIARVKRFLYCDREVAPVATLVSEAAWTGVLMAVAVAADCQTTGVLASIGVVSLSVFIGARLAFRLARLALAE